MGRMRSLLIPGVDKQLLVRDAVKTDAGPDAPALHRRRRQPRRADAADRLRRVRQFFGRGDAEAGLEIQRRRAGGDLQSRRAGADLSGKRDHQAVPVQRLLRCSTTRPRSTARTGSSRCAASSTTRSRGRWTSSTSCRRSSRSRATSASRAGARSEAGPARRCAISSNWSAPTPARNMCWFQCAERTATTRRWTWRPRCIRRPR